VGRHALLDLMIAGAWCRWLDAADRPATRDPKITATVRAIDATRPQSWPGYSAGRPVNPSPGLPVEEM
jgi:hypothetical protein